jgi:pSer/pThr/pTyr-binding forkhead associated (FHA) protein
MMNCHISLRLDNESTRSVWIQQGQTVQVGRTDRADFKVPEDQMMSRLHFVIESTSDVCLLRDLASRNGTFVNGALVSSCELADGDQILAGQSRFYVLMDKSTRGESQRGTSAPERVPDSAPGRNPSSNEKTIGVSPDSVASLIQAIRETGKLGSETILLDELEKRAAQNGSDENDNTLVIEGYDFLESPFSYDAFTGPRGEIYFSSHDRVKPFDLARILASRPGFYLVLNLQKLESATRTALASRSNDGQLIRLNDELVLIRQKGTVDRRLETFPQVWGRDAMIGIVSRLAEEHLVERIRSSAGNFRSPSEFLTNIRNCSADQLLHALADMDAILLEDTSIEKWSLVLNPLTSTNWASLGLPGPPERMVKGGSETV